MYNNLQKKNSKKHKNNERIKNYNKKYKKEYYSIEENIVKIIANCVLKNIILIYEERNMCNIMIPTLDQINDEGIYNFKLFIDKYFPNILEIKGNSLISSNENIVSCKILNSDSGGTISTKGNFDFISINFDNHVIPDFQFDIDWLKNPTIQNMISFNKEIYDIISYSYQKKKNTEYCTMLYREEKNDGNDRASGPASYDWYCELNYDEFKNLTMKDYKNHYSDLNDSEIKDIYDCDKGFINSGFDWYGYSELYHINIPKYKIDKDIIITGAYRGIKSLPPEVDKKVDASSYERIYIMQNI